MKLDKFNKLKQKFEVSSFENNFLTLDKVLYYFSFLGNILSVIFSYFFVKNATDSIPQFFPGQITVIALFIIIFMSGYELLKRFAFEQLVTYVVKLRKLTLNLVLGGVLVALLVGGSFYLSLNGSHRLIDQTETIVMATDSTLKIERDSIFKSYQTKIDLYQNQLTSLYDNSNRGRLRSKDKADIKEYEARVSALEKDRDIKLQALETKLSNKDRVKQDLNDSNTLALLLLVGFMEFIILLGVGFNAFYIARSFDDMKELMNSPKYKQMQINLQMLHLLYQNGNKKDGDSVIAITKFKSLVNNQKLDVRQKDIQDFLNYCSELEIVKTGNNRKKYYAMSYDKAKELIEKSIK